MRKQGLEKLMEEMVAAMIESATDEKGDGYPTWDSYEDGGLWILTDRSRDPRRSRNGGEYDSYTEFELRPDGVEIYEGDILDDVWVHGRQYKQSEVFFDAGCFSLRVLRHYWPCLWEISKKSLKVIGNIYENPELIKR